MEIGSLTTGATVSTSLSTNFLPQFLYYTAATQLTSLKVNVLGEGTITDLDAAGLNSIGQLMYIGKETNTYMIPLATGFFAGKNVTYTFVNSATQTPTIFVSSTNNAANNGGMYVICSSQQALAKSGATIKDFLSAHFPNSASTDLFSITFADNHQETNMARAELQARLQQKQYVSNTAADYMVLNQDQNVRAVSIIPDATQFIYATAFQQPGTKFMVGNPLG